ncbi:DUF3024 domain-containing protein [Paenibacillus albidus]|uniref:DUF3024 domain-containing protein n=1 Tax=Paenibacillus albidus TaxID=2041023 RepID=UPI001BE56216|nr:DUF3024 domain-containing protein [Paenibacillus albidus]MBT2291128.1 DUF3024 domain-containing protein [Paenibacillus albidus]
MLDPFTKKRIGKIMDEYVNTKNSSFFNHHTKLNYTINENMVTLVEDRPVFLYGQWTTLGVAQFRMNDNRWAIYWRDRKNDWHFVDKLQPDEDFEKLLEIVEQDRNGLFGT